ncbi:hypothetical protein Tco_1124164 [Tanacetum coccineum]|uniref:Uncharacterized protein n=1 Tax=Tanacetum coccineum TaxID=301880 RepID=A0ABQ5J5H2_9ASTR
MSKFLRWVEAEKDHSEVGNEKWRRLLLLALTPRHTDFCADEKAKRLEIPVECTMCWDQVDYGRSMGAKQGAGFGIGGKIGKGLYKLGCDRERLKMIKICLFWGADDEEISEGGIPRVIVLGYDGLPMQPVAPPSPDYIPGPEDPQTPPVPQDEDEREPMFVQAHDPDYVPEPIYPEYIPLEDEHEFPAEEQPLPPVDSPTAESPRYVTESDPEEDPEEYEDDETEDGPVDYPMDGGDDGDDDDGDSSGDDADGEDEDDEDEEEEEEEEHLAPADSAIVVPVDEPVFPPEGTEPVIPPPSTDITIGARITVRPQASISLPPEAEVERLLAMTTPSPSPPISLSLALCRGATCLGAWSHLAIHHHHMCYHPYYHHLGIHPNPRHSRIASTQAPY